MPSYAFKCLDDKRTVCAAVKLRLYKPNLVFSKYLKGFTMSYDIILKHAICNYGNMLMFCRKCKNMIFSQSQSFLFLYQLNIWVVCVCLLASAAYAWKVWSCSRARIWMCDWTVCLWMPDPRMPTGQPATTLTASRRRKRRRSQWQRGGGPASVSWAANSPPSFCPSRR